jgi:fumarate hydratase class II
METRTERDSMGAIEVPKDALWQAQTQRSFQNFKIGSEKMPEPLLHALILIKQAAAYANGKTGKLDEEHRRAIQKAADFLLTGEHWNQFPLVVWQTGSGTQTNMNANEVLATIATLNGTLTHPNDHVNMSQSSNDVFPTAIHVAASLEIINHLQPTITRAVATLKQLEEKYATVVKNGRTHLQDATPVTFGQEVSGWRAGLEHNQKMLDLALTELTQLAMGGTAVGTGLNATKEYEEKFINELNKVTGQAFTINPNHFHALASKDAVVFTSGALKALAANCMKMANDIRLLASGPRSGLGEINIPSNEPGSSIMPGKINPTQCEALTMVAVQVMGNDSTIGVAASQGNFELNVFMPVMAYNLLQSIGLLTDCLDSFTKNCLAGLTVNEKRMKELVDHSLMLVTALNSHIGYDNGAKIAKYAYEKNITLKKAALALDLVSAVEYDEWVNPEKMIGESK